MMGDAVSSRFVCSLLCAFFVVPLHITRSFKLRLHLPRQFGFLISDLTFALLAIAWIFKERNIIVQGRLSKSTKVGDIMTDESAIVMMFNPACTVNDITMTVKLLKDITYPDYPETIEVRIVNKWYTRGSTALYSYRFVDVTGYGIEAPFDP
ncbi:hypothetical protein CASFOL_015289 [Castilleja foliolosa]|uniref:Uncharacterized protein n=1 Tax=Castilleja foliolosa TaxID=1961234 RepID=A0ABD3DFB3_9LAMI